MRRLVASSGEPQVDDVIDAIGVRQILLRRLEPETDGAARAGWRLAS